MVLDGYVVEIDQSDHERVVLALPRLRLLVLGRTLDDAVERARAAIAFRVRDDDQPRQPAVLLRRRPSDPTLDGPPLLAPNAA